MPDEYWEPPVYKTGKQWLEEMRKTLARPVGERDAGVEEDSHE